MTEKSNRQVRNTLNFHRLIDMLIVFAYETFLDPLKHSEQKMAAIVVLQLPWFPHVSCSCAAFRPGYNSVMTISQSPARELSIYLLKPIATFLDSTCSRLNLLY